LAATGTTAEVVRLVSRLTVVLSDDGLGRQDTEVHRPPAKVDEFFLEEHEIRGGMEKRASYRVAQCPCPIISRAVMSGIRAERGEAELDSVITEIAELD
jgi:hypothetical protein